MGLAPMFGDEAFASSARAAGTYTSGPVANAGQVSAVLVAVHATAFGTSATLDVSLEESADGASWAAVGGSPASQLTAAGNRVAFARVTENFVRVKAVVATESVTFSAAVAVMG
ncbi:hypothetical protein GCM10010182_67550 [Actinomadura cremea]|nr:hypothetical protein GCM10010182_67550 [Actinomadura cremea]